MKIVIISSGSQDLQAVCEQLVRENPSRSIVRQTGGSRELRSVADREQPEMVILECPPHETEALSAVALVTNEYPQMAVIVLGAQQTPEFLIQAMQAGVREVLPLSPSLEVLEAAVARVEAKFGLRGKQRGGQIIAFVSTKGGSGSTFLSTNLAHQLGAGGKKVLLIDLNLQFGEAILTVHDRPEASDIAEVAANIARLDASLLSASTVKVTPNFSILAAPEDPSHSLRVQPEHLDAILSIAVDHYDFTVLDLNRTLDDLMIKALDRSHHICLVVQTMLPYIRNAKRVLTVFRSLGYSLDKVELLVNRFGRGADVSLEDLRVSLGLTRIRTVPNGFRDVANAINQGQALSLLAPSSVVSKAISEWAQSLLPKPELVSGGLLSRFLKF